MKSTKLDTTLVWKQLEDFLVPRLSFSVIDRSVYSHLLRHSRLEGKPTIRFSIAWLARGSRLSTTPTRFAIRRLLNCGALRLIQRSKMGHTVEVRLPEEILAAAPVASPSANRASRKRQLVLAHDLERTDFMQTPALRESIHQREGGFCFYCLRRLTLDTRCLDHVVPQAYLGPNSYRNLVSSCVECNCQKGERDAIDFLRRLYRDCGLTSAELDSRLRSLKALAAGQLRPLLDTTSNPTPRLGRPPLNPRL